MKVGVVIVVHDGIRYLPEQLESMEAQTRGLDAAVVVDDDSTDGSGSMALVALRRFVPRVQEVDAPLASTRGTFARVGQNFARGLSAIDDDIDLVLFADQDDIWEPTRISRQLAAFETNTELGLLAGNAVIIDSDGEGQGVDLWTSIGVPENWAKASAREIAQTLVAKPLVTGATMAASATWLRSLEPIPDGWLHDRWLSLVAAASGRLSVDPAIVIRYRVHQNQVAGLRGPSSPRLLGVQVIRAPLQYWRFWSDVRGLARLAPPDIRQVFDRRSVMRLLLSRRTVK